MRRAIVIVLDGCGSGAAPDAHEFGDSQEPNTLAHVWETSGPVEANFLTVLGWFRSAGVGPAPLGIAGKQISFGRLKPLSKGGKDSVTGHWEMMGIVADKPFPTYPNGFPASLVEQFEAEIGVKVLGNKPASGTAIISELGPEHMTTGNPILYTSADSVFQVAAHEEVIPIERLYEICQIGRKLCSDENGVQRVIARPFIGNEESGFTRTDRRKDFPLDPPQNLIDRIGNVFGIGVVPELFGGRGFIPIRRTQNNAEHAEVLMEALKSESPFIFANFEDTDMRFGHRNDPDGFARCLEEFDKTLQTLISQLTKNDLLIVTADHGNDPTDASTDHTREYVPYCEVRPGSGVIDLRDQDGFTYVGDVVARWLEIK